MNWRTRRTKYSPSCPLVQTSGRKYRTVLTTGRDENTNCPLGNEHTISRLLKCCDDYAVSHDIVYNVSKSCVLICSPNKTVTDPVFYIQNNIIERKTKAKYLGHIISDDMSDDADVFRQVKCLYIRGNM